MRTVAARQALKMTTVCSPFSKVVVRCMQRLYPECLADKSFDNTGLLLEAPLNRHRRLNNSVLLTIDLTKAVADEAIRRGDSIIIAYHPIIFRGLKSLTLANSQQQSLLRLAQEGISVYSPHTAVDAMPDSMADWLCNCAVPGGMAPTKPVTLQPSPSPPPGPQYLQAGMGRKMTLEGIAPLNDVLKSIAKNIFDPVSAKAAFAVAIPQGKSYPELYIETIAACPGSGSSILMKDGLPVADLLLTGELSHHDALAATEAGSVVVSLFHSNAERGYLRASMRGTLHSLISVEWEKERAMMRTAPEGEEGRVSEEIFKDANTRVDLSECDRDPYGIVISNGDNSFA